MNPDSVPDFVHLHVHTAYSLCEGAIKTGALAKEAAAFGMPAVAMTDINSLAGAPASTKDMTGAGVQPINGLQVTLDHPLMSGEIVLIAKNPKGFANLNSPADSKLLLEPLAGAQSIVGSHAGGDIFADTSNPNYAVIFVWIFKRIQGPSACYP